MKNALEPPSAPQTALTPTPNGSLRVQASLDLIAESLGGREIFLDACAQSDSEKGRAFLALWRSLPHEDQLTTSLQDLCTRSEMDATELLGSMMGKLIMQSNNHAILKAALARPQIMDISIASALGDDDIAFQERKLHFQMAGFIRGEGTQVTNLTQNIQGTGIVSFEDDSHQSAASVKAMGKPTAPPSVEPVPFDADGELAPTLEA